MPLYEFMCESCQKGFELLCPMGTGADSVRCPNCNKNHVKRAVSLFGFASGEQSSAGKKSGGCGSCSSSNCGSCHS